MKKGLMFGWLVALAIFSACQADGAIETEKENAEVKEEDSSEDTVLDRHGELTKEERLAASLENVESKKKDRISIISFTAEGDPIGHELSFDGSMIKLIVDSTKDQFGFGKVTEIMCRTIKEVEAAEQIDYALQGCNKGDGDIIVLAKWK
ncbi:DUF4362 domain-containing protein [Planomicrobium sp. CPCC 101110]|uniref:DUF4362 domain-containing protein n=1 Tax=Planomicrobium sp. CPCC 101110 TaxID=2599619 RepID=UPI0011B7AB50|nr:DUF4362 domain-containing protein [Planomicrobium sp. CPCC 101110]TWT26371.1 DUF4362 domain-containing protein [Planomicrobium sp. CPCC 101110]